MEQVSLNELYTTIVSAIENGVNDLSLIEDEQWERNDIHRNWVTSVCFFQPICSIDRRRAICDIYASYCSGCFPFVAPKERGNIFLEAIQNHFSD